MSTKKIANIVLNNFTNDARVLKTSKTLNLQNFDVEVFALHKQGLAEEELIDDIKVNRLKLFTKNLPKWKPIQLLKYFEFVIRAFFRLRNTVDAVHCNDLNALPIGYLLKRFSKQPVKVVYDCHEYETERDGMKPFVKKVLKFFEKHLIKHADTVICVSNEIANCYETDYGIEKPKLVLNCPNLSEQPKQDLFRESLNIRSDQKIFLYQGGLKSGRGIELLVEAFSQLEQDDNVLVCMGFGPLDKLIKEASQTNKTIFFHPAVTQDVLLNFTSSADYGILFYEDTCLNHRYCSPNKMFEYLMAGLPVLTSNLYEMKRLVESESVGIVASENTVEGFKQAVENSLNQDYAEIQKN
ncbi:MAG: glycosyltransferase, partial [Campylobacterales bacterium]|nr:glycosyltransferase [Campylobacterales bacterium]